MWRNVRCAKTTEDPADILLTEIGYGLSFVCDWEAPAAGTYRIYQWSEGFPHTMFLSATCDGSVVLPCVTAVAPTSWATVKALFR
jgi:hypothetical protein